MRHVYEIVFDSEYYYDYAHAHDYGYDYGSDYGMTIMIVMTIVTIMIMIITMITVLHGIYPPSSYWELEACEKLFEFLHTRKWLYGGSCYKSSTRRLGASIKWGGNH